MSRAFFCCDKKVKKEKLLFFYDNFAFVYMFSFFYEEIELSFFFNLEVFILVRYAYTGRRARQRMAEIIRELSSSIEVKVRKFLNAKRSKLSGFW